MIEMMMAHGHNQQGRRHHTQQINKVGNSNNNKKEVNSNTIRRILSNQAIKKIQQIFLRNPNKVK